MFGHWFGRKGFIARGRKLGSFFPKGFDSTLFSLLRGRAPYHLRLAAARYQLQRWILVRRQQSKLNRRGRLTTPHRISNNLQRSGRIPRSKNPPDIRRKQPIDLDALPQDRVVFNLNPKLGNHV